MRAVATASVAQRGAGHQETWVGGLPQHRRPPVASRRGRRSAADTAISNLLAMHKRLHSITPLHHGPPKSNNTSGVDDKAAAMGKQNGSAIDISYVQDVEVPRLREIASRTY